MDNLLQEVSDLRERMEKLLPTYIASLDMLSQAPEEFTRRFWASCVEALLQKVRAEYQKYQAQAQKADFLGKFMTLGIEAVLKAGGMEPIPPAASLQVGMSISPSGKIEPALIDDPYRQSDAILITFEQFEAIAQRLRGEILKGMIVPKSEDEISKLIYGLAAEQK